MKRFCPATASIILLLAAAPVLAQSARTIKRTVTKDVETMIIVHSNSFKPSAGMLSCVQGGPVAIVITTPPTNGTISLRPATDKTPNCTNELAGAGIFYRPKPGFTGTDTLSYDRTDQGVREVQKATGPQGLRTVTIEVVSCCPGSAISPSLTHSPGCRLLTSCPPDEISAAMKTFALLLMRRRRFEKRCENARA